MKRIITVCLTVLASLLVASLAFAASAKQGVAIIVEGADAEAVRREVAASIPQGMPAQDPAELSAAIASQGVRGSLADSLAHPKTRKQTLAAVRKALKQVGLPAAISARSKKVKGGGHEIRVVLIVRGQAEPMIEENIAVGKNDKASAQLSPLLAVPLQDLANAPPPAAAAEPEAAAPAEKGSPKKEAKEAKKDDEEEPLPAASNDDKDSGPAKKRGAVTY